MHWTGAIPLSAMQSNRVVVCALRKNSFSSVVAFIVSRAADNRQRNRWRASEVYGGATILQSTDRYALDYMYTQLSWQSLYNTKSIKRSFNSFTGACESYKCYAIAKCW